MAVKKIEGTQVEVLNIAWMAEHVIDAEENIYQAVKEVDFQQSFEETLRDLDRAGFFASHNKTFANYIYDWLTAPTPTYIQGNIDASYYKTLLTVFILSNKFLSRLFSPAEKKYLESPRVEEKIKKELEKQKDLIRNTEYFAAIKHLSFSYYDDEGYFCGVSIVYCESDPSLWTTSIIRNTTAAPENRQAQLIVSDEEMVGAGGKTIPPNQAQFDFLSFLHSEKVARIFSNVLLENGQANLQRLSELSKSGSFIVNNDNTTLRIARDQANNWINLKDSAIEQIKKEYEDALSKINQSPDQMEIAGLDLIRDNKIASVNKFFELTCRAYFQADKDYYDAVAALPDSQDWAETSRLAIIRDNKKQSIENNFEKFISEISPLSQPFTQGEIEDTKKRLGEIELEREKKKEVRKAISQIKQEYEEQISRWELIKQAAIAEIEQDYEDAKAERANTQEQEEIEELNLFRQHCDEKIAEIEQFFEIARDDYLQLNQKYQKALDAAPLASYKEKIKQLTTLQGDERRDDKSFRDFILNLSPLTPPAHLLSEEKQDKGKEKVEEQEKGDEESSKDSSLSAQEKALSEGEAKEKPAEQQVHRNIPSLVPGQAPSEEKAKEEKSTEEKAQQSFLRRNADIIISFSVAFTLLFVLPPMGIALMIVLISYYAISELSDIIGKNKSTVSVNEESPSQVVPPEDNQAQEVKPDAELSDKPLEEDQLDPAILAAFAVQEAILKEIVADPSELIQKARQLVDAVPVFKEVPRQAEKAVSGEEEPKPQIGVRNE